METAIPSRTKDYRGPVNNTDIWQDFALRSDDVVVVTPPKCGTTWTQIIVTSLMAGRPLDPRAMGDVSYWLDCGMEDREDLKKKFEAQDFRRCIKSHSPLDGITYDPRCTYFAVYRHPIDAHFSMSVHAWSMQNDILRWRYPEDTEKGFEMFLYDELFDGANDAMDLHSIVYHYTSVQRWTHLPNVHLFHYADMLADLNGQVARMAGILGLEDAVDLVGQIAEATTFSNIKKVAVAAERESGKDEFYLGSRFFNSGTSGKWAGRLSDGQMAAFDARMKVLLPDDVQRNWLLWGSGGSR